MNITVNSIIEELTNRGYIVSEQTCIKNGIEKKGVSVKKSEEDRIAPTLYLEEVVEDAEERNMTLSEVVDSLENLVSREFSFDVDKLFSADYLAEHIRIGVQREGTEELIKKTSEFEGIEEYLYIADTNNGESFSIKLKPRMAEQAGLTEEYLFEVAERNNHEEFTAQPLMNLIAQMMGTDSFGSDGEVAPMYVLSNKSNIKGASAMLDKKGIAELADRIGVHEFVLLPSSIHECILVPKTSEVDMKMFENMVKEVNATTVDPLERLVDRAYLLTA
ncbi:hypothetical protein bpr_IV168 (plasmid) [Butyrivibrio proteoclasticus B316]|uniref:Uncharacterized protein n=1 Tax=Butyrivibrio proteoclasticus (strain ATCC 51982 / DSM 14932 / B316) TaxID=515622 RepID=E0S550_BUTPB|nr:DUF5688 family protein [Butyrivibrio proteoclasticus]ADL36532.1 hypothetical protein bpr_IV168 [Butyrivibrio proteoclasticus B316]